MRLLAILMLAGFAAGQTPLPVASLDVTWTNTTGVGSAVLATRVFMPVVSALDDAVSAGTAALAPATMPARGWPTVVFLHGFGLQGRDYEPLCVQLASQGLLVLAPDTGVCDHVTLTHDVLANVEAALVASGDPASPLYGMVDVGRLGVAGHSMGAACMAIAMTANPGFRCAYAIAPVSPFGYLPAVVDVPVGVAVGAGDTITSWSQHALPFYDQSTPRSGVKMIHCFDASSTHMSIAGLTGGTADFVRTADICAGFFRHFLGVDDGGMERCIGPAVFADPTLVAHEQTVIESRIWPAATPRIGQLTRVSVAAASGSLAILVADEVTTGLPTVYGTLLLDPALAFTWAVGSASCGPRMDAMLAVPNAPSLIGLSVAMQPLAPTSLAGIRFGDATAFVVGS